MARGRYWLLRLAALACGAVGAAVFVIGAAGLPEPARLRAGLLLLAGAGAWRLALWLERRP